MRSITHIVLAFSFCLSLVSCVQAPKSQSSATDSFTATKELRKKLVADIANVNSDVYKNPAEKIALLKKMAIEKPEKYRAVVDKMNMLRMLRGKKPLKPEQLTGHGARSAHRIASLPTATPAPEVEASRLAGCMAARMEAAAPAAAPSGEADEDSCPDNCVCVSAFAAAEAWSDVYAYGSGFAWANATATCASGEVVTVSAEAWARAYAEAHAYAYAIAYAYAFACAPEPSDSGCEARPGACGGVGDGPVATIPVPEAPTVEPSDTPIPTPSESVVVEPSVSPSPTP